MAPLVQPVALVISLRDVVLYPFFVHQPEKKEISAVSRPRKSGTDLFKNNPVRNQSL